MSSSSCSEFCVWAEWREAEGAPTVLLYGHYDVQPVEPNEFSEEGLRKGMHASALLWEEFATLTVAPHGANPDVRAVETR